MTQTIDRRNINEIHRIRISKGRSKYVLEIDVDEGLPSVVPAELKESWIIDALENMRLALIKLRETPDLTIEIDFPVK